MGMNMIVHNPGFLTTVQDLGRYGYQQYGMPVAGAMDGYALQAANIIVGNNRNEAGLEITFGSFSVEFEGKGLVSLAGADLNALLNDKEVKPWQSFEVLSGDRLKVTGNKDGCRAYLAVQGGIEVPIVMGSKSTYLRGKLGGFKGRKLSERDIIKCGGNGSEGKMNCIRIPKEFVPDYKRRNIRIIMGPQDDCFSREEQEKFLSATYQITNQYDRMGYRLEGPIIKHQKGPDIISDGIASGAIQIPGNGQPIIMLADRQTTGGYTKIANVISVDLPLLAQLKPGDMVTFKRESLEEAQKLCYEQESKLTGLADYIKKIDAGTQYLVRIKGREYMVYCKEIR
ncbi:MAG: biotin-dependent carboxyltransferase family protein [Dehalobacterium sp.]